MEIDSSSSRYFLLINNLRAARGYAPVGVDNCRGKPVSVLSKLTFASDTSFFAFPFKRLK